MSDLTPSDTDLLAALQRQDHAAFCRLVQQQHRRMLRFAATLVGVDGAEDVMQEAWLAVWKALPTFEGRAALSTWLYTIVRHACLARLRREGVATPVAPRDDETQAELDADGVESWYDQAFVEDGHWRQAPAESHLNTPEALLEERQLLHCIEHHLQALQPNQRAVFELRDIEQLEIDEICNMLQLSSSNVRVLLHRARLKLQQVLDHYHRTGEC